MTMVPFNGDLTQAMKWMQSNAPNIQSLVNQKAAWYAKYNDSFWSDFQVNTFDLRTANNFGLLIWCIILGVPSQLFGLYPTGDAWAYGTNRQNYIYDPTFDPGHTLPSPNTIGGNFYGGGNTTVVDLADVRAALQLRYVALVSNGSVKWINYMLNWIFGGGEPWNFAAGKYFYLADNTLTQDTVFTVALQSNGVTIPSANYTINQTTGAVTFGSGHAPAAAAVLTWSGHWNFANTSAPIQFGTGNGTNLSFTLVNAPGAVPPVTQSGYMEYRIGPNMGLSSQFLNLLNSPQYGITPSCAGIKYLVVQESF